MSKKTKTSTKPYNPAAINAAQAGLTDAVNQNAGQLQSNANLINSSLPSLAQSALTPDPSVTAASGYLGNVLGGAYLGQGNPYTQDMIDQTDQSVRNQVASTFGAAGRTGSFANQEALTKGLADSENNLRYQDYANERNAMGQAAATAPSVAAGQYAGIAPFLQALQTGSSLPYLGAQTLAQGTAQLQSPYSTQTQTQGLGNSLMNIAGLGLMAFGGGGPFAGLMKSDRRSKKNIEKVGRLGDGLGIYEFDYRKGEGPEGRQVGVMAQEVAKKRPQALGPFVNGRMTVNYGAL